MEALGQTYRIRNLEAKNFVWFLFEIKSRKQFVLLLNILTKPDKLDN